ncbi:MAG: undecaprenyl-diphosphate phosphatase [Clostridia bacterium]|nr:undecaprenyl-diphosphate phosphatase [Clostridia bacterium]
MDIIELLKVILIGIVEGITEWLPISSTGHMLLVDEFLPLQMSEEFKEMFFVVIQLGAILAVLVLFWNKMFPFQFKDKSKPVIRKDIFGMWFRVIAGVIPSAVLGLLFDDFLEAHFGNAVTIAIMLILYGIVFILIENRKREPKINDIMDISYKTAILIGCFQVLSMIPGTSRSGATIIGALLLGVSRTAAAEFTFFLALPTMLGASALKIVKYDGGFTSPEIITMVVGLVVAFVVSLLSIRFLMDYVKKHDFKVFGWYRIVLGIIVLAVFLLFM